MLADLGYEAQTVDDPVGSFKNVIDAVVLDGFAVIALLAAGFGTTPALRAARQDPIKSLHYE